MHRLVIALVSLIGLTGAAFVASYLLIFSALTDRAAALAPAQTALYVNVYLQPSTAQQMNVAGLVGRLPGFADDASLDDKIDQVAQNLMGAVGVDYRAQLKPWLGDQVAFAAWPGEEGIAEPALVLIIDVKDREAAESALAALAAERGTGVDAEEHAGVELMVIDDGTAYAFVDEMLAVGPDAAVVRAVIDASRGAGSLSQREDFQATVDGLPGDHLALAFMDIAALAASADMAEGFGGYRTAGAVLVAEPDGLRLSGSAPLARDVAASPDAGPDLGSAASSLVDWMPADTIAEMTVFGLPRLLESLESAAAGTPQGAELGNVLDGLRLVAALGFGIDLDADVLPLLDREVALAVSGVSDVPSGQLLLRPNDLDAAAASLERIATQLESAGGQRRDDEVIGGQLTVLTLPEIGDVAYAVTDEVVILGLGADDVEAALDAHASGDSLAANGDYRRTFELAGTRGGTEIYVDVGALAGVVGDEAALPDDARDILAQIGTFGFTAASRDDHLEFHAVLTIDDARAE